MLTGVIGPPRSDGMTGPVPVVILPPGARAVAQARVDGNQPAAVLLGRAVAQLDHVADFAGGIDHHVPGQLGDLASPQAGLDRQQHDQPVSDRVPGAAGEHEEVAYISS